MNLAVRDHKIIQLKAELENRKKHSGIEEKKSRKSTRSRKLNTIDNVDSTLKEETESVSSDSNEE